MSAPEGALLAGNREAGTVGSMDTLMKWLDKLSARAADAEERLELSPDSRLGRLTQSVESKVSDLADAESDTAKRQ